MTKDNENTNDAGTEEETSILGKLMEEAEAGSSDSDDGNPPDEAELLQRQLKYEKQRNDSLQGRIDSQLKPMNTLVKQLQSKVEELQGGSGGDRIKIPQITREDILAELTPEERSKIGDKQLDVLVRMIENPLKTMAEKLEKKILPRVQAAESQIAARAGEDLWARVDEVSPGALADNDAESPEWVAFLSSKDPVSGKMYRDLGNAAVDAGDVDRLAQLHRLFKKTSGAASEEESGTDIRSQLRPTGSRAEPYRGSGDSKPKIKSSEVDKFYADLSRGKYSGKPELVEKMDTMISSAIEENRVIPG